jgi:hypothetical protein
VTGGDIDKGPVSVDIDTADLQLWEGKEFDLDQTRKNFTWFVLGTFGITVLASLLSAFTGDWKAMLQVLERLLPAQSAVVGATLGFYFISRPVDL